MALINKGLYYLEGNERRISYTLFECTSGDTINFNGMHFESSVLVNAVNLSLKCASNTTFSNGVTLREVSGYSYFEFYKSGVNSLYWGGNGGTSNNRKFWIPLFAVHIVDTDDYYLNISFIYYDPIPAGNPQIFDNTATVDVISGTPGYFVGDCVYNRNYSPNQYTTILTRINPTTQAPQYELFKNGKPFSTDPYYKGGESDTGGGGGDFDRASDPINIPALPTVSAVDTGFITLYNPTLSELRNLAAYMWSTGFDISTLKKMFADPMDCILGLSIVPVDVPSGTSQNVGVGNIDTGVTMTLAATQYVEVDCGTINVSEYWGAYLDYAPFTKVELYLPYIGAHPLSADDVMGKAVNVVYHIDILSGACTAFVKCGDSVLYQFIGQCSASIPISGNDWTNVINGVLAIAGAIGTMVATGGSAAPVAMGAVASTAANGSLKPDVEKSGSVSGTGGILAIQKPYLTITRPRQALPSNQNSILGYPSFVTLSLNDISGYTVVDEIHPEGILATDSEINEIVALMKSGVIL